MHRMLLLVVLILERSMFLLQRSVFNQIIFNGFCTSLRSMLSLLSNISKIPEPLLV
jgi:hypothetical protein